ncbi:hypothetical protein Hanom_Chr07g00582281 [Helianthus anomalus]
MSWIEELKQVCIDGAVIDVNLAKFDRDGSKIEVQNRERMSVFDRLNAEGRVSVFSRLQNKNLGSMHARPLKVDSALYQKNKTYSSVVNPGINVNSTVDIELPPMNTKTKKN